MFQCVSEEAVGYTVDFADASFVPLSSSLSEMCKSLDDDICVEAFGEFDNFVAYLPHPRSNIVSLLSAEPIEFEPSLTSRYRISIPLEFGSPLLKPELLCGNGLSVIHLLQYSTFTNYRNGDFGAVYVDTHPIWSDNGLRHVLLEHSKEFEVLLHYDAGYPPTLPEMFLKALIGSVLAYGKPYSLMVESKAEGRVAQLCLFEAEEPPVKANYAPTYITSNGFSVAPSVARSLNHKLTGYMVLTHEPHVGGVMKLPSTSNTIRSRKGILYDTEKGSVGLPEKTLLSLCWLKNVKNEALLHVANPKDNMLYFFKRLRRNSSHG